MMTTERSRDIFRCRSLIGLFAMIAIAFASFHISAAHAQGAPPAFPVTVAPPLIIDAKEIDTILGVIGTALDETLDYVRREGLI